MSLKIKLVNGIKPAIAIDNQYRLVYRLQASINASTVDDIKHLTALFTMLDYEKENLLKMRGELDG